MTNTDKVQNRCEDAACKDAWREHSHLDESSPYFHDLVWVESKVDDWEKDS